MVILPSRKNKGRTSKKGIFTDLECSFLKGEIEFNSNQKSSFFKSLNPRLEACTQDIQLFWESTKNKDSLMEKWIRIEHNYRQLQQIGNLIHPRSHATLEPYKIGRIKIITSHPKERGPRRYWLDEKDRRYIKLTDLSWPEHVLRSIKSKSLKTKFREALILENKFHFRKIPYDPKDMKQIIIPRNEDGAITIKEIVRRTERLRKKLSKS